MKRIAVALALVAVAACNKAASSSAAVTTSASAAPPPAPFTGTLTGERIMGAKGIAHPFQKWTDAEPKLEAQMGKATYVKDGKMHMWAVAQGDDCWYVEVEKQDDGTVGIVSDPMKISKGGAIMNWDDCLTAAGVRKDPVDDPNAPGPPTDGKPITVTELQTNAVKARSKWDKATVTVKGYLGGVTRATGTGAEPTATITLSAAKKDNKSTVGCTLADAKTAPEHVLQDTPMKVTGTVDIEKMMSLAGDTHYEVWLKSCSITK